MVVERIDTFHHHAIVWRSAFPTCPASCGAVLSATTRLWSLRMRWAMTSYGRSGSGEVVVGKFCSAAELRNQVAVRECVDKQYIFAFDFPLAEKNKSIQESQSRKIYQVFHSNTFFKSRFIC